MAIPLKVQWVEQSDQPERHLRIRRIGGISRRLRWKYTQAQAVESIEHGLFAYYVERDARALRLIVGYTTDGQKYLTVPGEEFYSQLLLELPDFPPPAS